jgi:hypothetical protein
MSNKIGERKLSAFQCAGSAVMAYLQQVHIKEISIREEDEFGGFFEWEDLFGEKSYPINVLYDDLLKLEKNVMIVLAGPIAASIVEYGKIIWSGEEDGYDHAIELLGWIGSLNESSDLLFTLYSKRCELMLNCPDVWFVVKEFASRLIKKKRLLGHEAEKYLKDLFDKA